MSQDEAIRRADVLGRILAEPVFVDAIEAARQGCIERWQETDDQQKQYAEWAALRGLSALEAEFRRILSDGEHARAVINKRQ